MTESPDYHTATNAAYRILNDVYPFQLSTDIFQIINNFSNISIHTYSEIANKFEFSFDSFLNIASSEFGYTVQDKKSGNSIICYNDIKDICTIRFTLAHELGHIVLNHTKDNDISRKEASCFARNILCPISTVKELNLHNISDYTNIFNISDSMADVAIQYAKSDFYYIQNNYYRDISDKVFAYMNGYDNVFEMYGYNPLSDYNFSYA